MKYFVLILTIGTFLAISCHGNSGHNIITPSIGVSFTPSQPNPDPMSVTLQKNSEGDDSFTIDVVITDVTDVYSISFNLTYDGTLLDYLNYTEGPFLDKDGALTTFSVNEQTGEILVLAGRLGAVSGVDAVGNETLMSIAFRVKKTGSTSLTFANNHLLDSNGVEILVDWYGGTATGNY